MEIAIPSYKRSKTLQGKTLSFLRREGIPAERITVFVASEEEKKTYKTSMCYDYSPKIVVGVLGIHKQREFIQSYYPSGTRVVCMDDDVVNLKRPFNLGLKAPELFEMCFDLAEEEECRLWGFYPTDHGLSLVDRAVKGLTYIIGACYGVIAGPDNIQYPNPFTEDFTRSVEYYRRGYGVLRFEGVGITTRYFKEPGGLQMFRTEETQRQQMLEFVAAYPDDSKLRERDGKMTDVKLVRRIEKTIAKPLVITV